MSSSSGAPHSSRTRFAARSTLPPLARHCSACTQASSWSRIAWRRPGVRAAAEASRARSSRMAAKAGSGGAGGRNAASRAVLGARTAVSASLAIRPSAPAGSAGTNRKSAGHSGAGSSPRSAGASAAGPRPARRRSSRDQPRLRRHDRGPREPAGRCRSALASKTARSGPARGRAARSFRRRAGARTGPALVVPPGPAGPAVSVPGLPAGHGPAAFVPHDRAVDASEAGGLIRVRQPGAPGCRAAVQPPGRARRGEHVRDEPPGRRIGQQAHCAAGSQPGSSAAAHRRRGQHDGRACRPGSNGPAQVDAGASGQGRQYQGRDRGRVRRRGYEHAIGRADIQPVGKQQREAGQRGQFGAGRVPASSVPAS